MVFKTVIWVSGISNGLLCAGREQALLQAAIVPDEEAGKCGDATFIKADEADLDIEELPYEIEETDGIVIEDGRITAEKDNASFVISLHDVPECQLLVSFDDLLRNSKDGKNGSSYEIYASDDRIRRTVLNHKSRQGVRGLKDHDINMGHVSGDERVRISLSDKGDYTFSKMYVSAMSVENYDRHAAECMEQRLDVESFSDKLVKGQVFAKEDGILFLSMYAAENWDIYIDGQKADPIRDLDTTFLGAAITKGGHEITLKYNNRFSRIGYFTAAAGILLTALIELRRNKGKRRKLANDAEANIKL